MPSKLQKERRKNVAMMIYEIERLLLSSKVSKKRTPKASKRG
jgi:CRISPR/Cas system-associated exonuclease Cas4 (RecB family)